MNRQTQRMLGNIDVDQQSKELLSNLGEYINIYIDAIVDKFVMCFEKFAKKVVNMQRLGKKEAVAYINFSVLRTNILAKKHFLRIDAYDRDWYSDRTECSSEYDVTEIYQWLDKFQSVLEAVRKKSGGQITLSDVQALVFEESDKYLLLVTEVIRASMKKVAETESYQKMNKYEVFVVCVGRFQDQSYFVYKEDTSVKDAKAVKLHLQAKRQGMYSYEICEKLNLSGGNYEDKKFLFSSFSESDFTGSNFKKSTMIGCNFHNAVLRDTNFEQIQAFDIDFSGVALENVSFKGAKLTKVSFAEATLTHVQFEGAILLENLNFENAKFVETERPTEQTLSR